MFDLAVAVTVGEEHLSPLLVSCAAWLAFCDGDAPARALGNGTYFAPENRGPTHLARVVLSPVRGTRKRRGIKIARVTVTRKALTLVHYGLRDGEARCLRGAEKRRESGPDRARSRAQVAECRPLRCPGWGCD
ncbi:MAG: hypothetical protein M3P85_11495 [Actinomycetota bacterium]|nr:hypothetical protein [Actinomycetota bacterium]